MATIEELKTQISSAQDLQSVVKTMKALATVSIRQYEKAVESLVSNVELKSFFRSRDLARSHQRQIRLANHAPLKKQLYCF
jgi:F0F1-type ATP synthase gamma subunit